MNESGCYLCELPGVVRVRHTFGAFSVGVCTRCGLGQLVPMPSSEQIDALYRGRSYFDESDGGSSGYSESYDRLAPYLERAFARDVAVLTRMGCSGDLLEVGCGPGAFLRLAASAGFRARGLDISEHAVEAARAQHLDARATTLEEYAGDYPHSSDIVYACQVIEHVPDPKAFVAAAAGVLRPGGLLVCITPNRRSWLARISGRRWVSFKIPEHLYYFDPSTLRRLLDPYFDVRAVRPVWGTYPLTLVVRRLRQLGHPLTRAVPRFEDLPSLGDRAVSVLDGSTRVMAVRR